jgi:hypothetical protein
MKRNVGATLLLLLFKTAFAAFPKNATIRIGNFNGTGSQVPIPVIIDPSHNDTLIAGADFSCTKDTGCWLEADSLYGNYRNYSYIYRVGHAPMNVADYQFNQSATFRYLANGTDVFGSILGFGASSDFLHYYHEQNVRLNYDIKLRVGPENFLYFVKEVAKNAIDLHQEQYVARLSSSPAATWNKELVIFCVSPLYDYFQDRKSWVGVRQEVFPQWKQLPGLADDKSKLTITISLLNSDQGILGNITIPGKNLVDPSGNLVVSTFQGSAWQECDIITGTYLLKSLNYSVYYQEGQKDGFSLKHLIWEANFNVESSSLTFWNILVILILLAVFVGVCFYGYKYYFWQGTEGRVSEEYRSLFEPTELRETPNQPRPPQAHFN